MNVTGNPGGVETALTKFRSDFDAKAVEFLSSVDRRALAAMVMVVEAKKLQTLFDLAETDDAMASAKMRGGVMVMDDLLYLFTSEISKRTQSPEQTQLGEQHE